ncbi:hypothetical protein [Arthrobacter sp. 2MCAF14]|uniref:hypothetical protein n=1 Tax=Arthrobacter sp. 2MCAF14 TaxID=3232982 RepID=UPI003F92BCA8
MAEIEYRGQSTLLATIVPARAAYLVQENSRDGFRRAVQEASTRWAGMTEPIVPVSGDGHIDEATRRMLDLAGVDGLVNVDLSVAEAETASEELGLPWVPLDQARWADPLIWTCNPAGVGTTPVQGSSYVVADADADADLWMVTAAGTLPTDYITGMQDQLFPIRSSSRPDYFGRSQLGEATWLNQTTTSFGETYGSQIPLNYPAVLWITKDDDLQDCWEFWNVRALRPVRDASSVPMVLLPVGEVQHWLEFDRQLAAYLARPDQFSPDVVLTSRTASEAEMLQIADVLHLQPNGSDKVQPGGGYPIPDEQRHHPYTYTIWNDVSQFVNFQRVYGTDMEVDVHIFKDTTTVQFSSPVVFRGGGNALLRLNGAPFEGLPRHKNVASLIAKGATWHKDSLQLGVFAQQDYRLQIHVPSLPESLHVLLQDVTVSYKLSDKGSLADGLQQMRGAESLLKPGIFETIRELISPRSTQFLKDLKRLTKNGEITPEVEEFAHAWAGQGKRRYKTALDLPNNEAWLAADVLEDLCAVSWAERGFEIKCSRCRTSSFVPLAGDSSRGPAKCPACRDEQKYTSSNSKTYDRSIFYRLDGFVDTASDQGVLPHLLAIAELTQREPRSWFLPGVDLKFKDGTEMEADILGVYAGRFLSGEAKMSGKDFNTKQIDNDIHLAAAVGADIYVMAAPDDIPETAKAEAVEKCEASGIDLIVLDRTDLRPTCVLSNGG